MKVLLIALAFCLLPLVARAGENTLMLEASGNKVTYSLNGVDLPLAKLMDSTTDIVGRDVNEPIRIIFDSSIGLDVVLNAQGIFNKVGFQKVRLFALARKTGKMSEVSLGLPVPFQLHPK